MLLGDQALRLAVLVFIALRFRSRLRFFPMWQQSLAVWLLLLNNHVLQALIRAFAGAPAMPVLSWLAPAVGAAIWPFVFLLLDDVNTRVRGGGQGDMNRHHELPDERARRARFARRALAGFAIMLALVLRWPVASSICKCSSMPSIRPKPRPTASGSGICNRRAG